MQRHSRSILSLDRLEGRATPATLVGASTVTYMDLDGDTVAVTFSKPVLTSDVVANAAFHFNPGTVNGNNANGQVLNSIDFTQIPNSGGIGLTITSTRGPGGGDGFVAVGEIDANGLDLGAVTIDGDLGSIQAGDAAAPAPGLKALSVQSLGRNGLSTGAATLLSLVSGPVGSIKVRGDVVGAALSVAGGVDGTIGSIAVGGSLIGSDVTIFRPTFSADSDIGTVTIAGDVVGGAVSPAGIESEGAIKSVKIGGSIRAGKGLSGSITAVKEIGKVTLGGSLEGGTPDDSGIIASTTLHIKSVAIGGSIIGGVGKNSGTVSPFFDLRKVTVAHDVIGGTGTDSGQISNLGDMGKITIGGSIIGGFGARSGSITSGGKIDKTSVLGNLIGGNGPDSGQIHAANKLIGAKIGGSIIGGVGTKSGAIVGDHDVGPVLVLGDLVGGVGANSASILPNTTLDSAIIGGSLRGGSGTFSARILVPTTSGPIKVTGDLIGQGDFAGSIAVNGTAKSIAVGGSLRGGSKPFSASVTVGTVETIAIGGDVIGGSAGLAVNLQNSGCVQVGGAVKSLTIGGSLIAGTDTTSGTFENNGVIVGSEFGTILIKGSIVGNTTAAAKIQTFGAITPTTTTDIALGKLTVLGRVEFGQILAGYTILGDPENADAQIGSVTVGGDWIASSLAAGVVPTNAFFGDADDAKITGAGIRDQGGVSSSIGLVIIGGQVQGTLAGGDHFGIVAEQVGQLKIGDTAIPLAVGKDDVSLGTTGDFEVREV